MFVRFIEIILLKSVRRQDAALPIWPMVKVFVQRHRVARKTVHIDDKEKIAWTLSSRGRHCAAHNCTNNRKSKQKSSLFRFPKAHER